MTLPPRALFVLADLKKQLLSKEMPPSDVVFAESKKPQTFNPSHGRARTNAFQRGCQRREWWSPVH